MPQAHTIQQVIDQLEEIITWSMHNNSRLGYFAALYRKVTVEVQNGIQNGFFDDGPRMERLDVIFANRYLVALDQYRQNQPTSRCWKLAFDTSVQWLPIVLQHLLLGMNAHINLDLAVAAAHTLPPEKIDSLQEDFNKINNILNRLTGDVQQQLAEIWPPFKWLDMTAGRFDELASRFGIEIARNKAWMTTKSITRLPKNQWPQRIDEIDKNVFEVGRQLLLTRRWWFSLGLFAIRIGEKRNVKEIIDILML